MASLQVRHQRTCRTFAGAWKPAATAKRSAGCNCEPTYYVVSMIGNKPDRQRVGTNPQAAERALNTIRHEQDSGAYQPLQNITFERWATEWTGALRGQKATTLNSYRVTLDYAKRAFGSKTVRNLTAVDIDRFLGLMAHISPSTQAKHLRVLNACLAAAVRRGYAGRNPIESLGKDERPRAAKREAAYFINGEVEKLLRTARDWDRPLYQLAFMTGMREGELAALTWGHVDLSNQLIHVRQQYTGGKLDEMPKTDTSRRDVELTEAAVNLLGKLWGEQGSPADNVLVFPSARGGYRSPTGILSQFKRTMARAGIPRVGPTGAKRTFHSTRHTHAKVALESGMLLAALSRSLGHASVQVTDEVYGHFEREARKREMRKLDTAFVV